MSDIRSLQLNQWFLRQKFSKKVLLIVIVLFTNDVVTAKSISIKNGMHIVNYSKNKSSRKTVLKKIEQKSRTNYKIIYETSFKNLKLINEFRDMNIRIAKKKYCRDTYYEIMKKGLTFDISFYQTNTKFLITAFRLNKESCRVANNIFAELGKESL